MRAVVYTGAGGNEVVSLVERDDPHRWAKRYWSP